MLVEGFVIRCLRVWFEGICWNTWFGSVVRHVFRGLRGRESGVGS